MKIADVFSVAFKVATDKLTAELTSALKSESLVKDIKVENLSAGRSVKLKVRFTYAEAKVSAWCDGEFLRPDNMWSSFITSDIVFEGAHQTIPAMLSAVRLKYVAFLKELAARIVAKPLMESSLSRKQIVLMRQSALIEAGFDVECEYTKSGDFRLRVSHEACKGKRGSAILLDVKVA